jgi:hypothetical protein
MEPIFDIMARQLNVRRVIATGLCVLMIDLILFCWLGNLDDYDGLPPAIVLSLVLLGVNWPAVLLGIVLPNKLDVFGLGFGLILTALFWGIIFEMLFQKFTPKRPIKSL